MEKTSRPTRVELKAVLANAPEEFQLPAAAALAGVPEESLERMIDTDADFFRDGGRVCRREGFFNGRKFLITPDEWEIEAGILVPGHRFIPYVDEEVFPSEVELRRGRGRAPTREECFPLSRVIAFFPLLGSAQLWDVLAAESPENGRLRSGARGDSEVALTVFDLKDFYLKNNFEAGDALKCETVDYRAGIVKFGYLSGVERRGVRKKAFIQNLDVAMEKAISRFGDYLDIPELLAWGVFFGDAGLKVPDASTDEFLRESLHIVLTSGENGDGVLRVVGGEERDSDAAAETIPDGFALSAGETGSLAAMLKSTGALVTPDELDGFMLDACATREMDFNGFFSRAFRHCVLDFTDDAQEAVLMNVLEERFENFCEHYDRVDDEIKAPLRSSLMEMVEDRLDFLGEAAAVEGGTEKLNVEKMRRLALISGQLSELLRMLNREDFMPDAAEAERIEALLESRLDDQDAALEALRGDLSQK